MKITSSNPDRFFFLYLAFWFIINLSFLSVFPFLHTDEPWLAGLSRAMMEEMRPDATEPFFDLYARHPHGIKILYHLFQIPYILLFGYSLYSVRLLSLTGGLACLIAFYRILSLLSKKAGTVPVLPFAISLLFSWDIQFLYASHMARQESIILAMMVWGIYYYLVSDIRPSAHIYLLIGAVTGLAVGFHPNAFLTAWPVGLLLLTDVSKKRVNPGRAILYLSSAAFCALLFILVSLLFNRQFIHDYGAFGSSVGVADSLDVKLIKWPLFHRNIIQRTGGTYYLPDIRYLYYLFPLLVVWIFLKKKTELRLILAGITGINTGLIILGKYSQPSIVFFVPFFYLALFSALSGKKGNSPKNKIALPAVFIFLTFSLYLLGGEIRKERGYLNSYFEKITETIPEDSVALGGLSLEFYLDKGELYDWRNLSYLDRDGNSLSLYMEEREIEYVVIPSEIAYLYENRPRWNSLYGNPSYWYPALVDYLESEGSLIARYSTPGYGTRISAYRYRIPEETLIYRISSDDFNRE